MLLPPMIDDESYDPAPEAPEPPGDGMCCGSGCDPCVWDSYQQALTRYQHELAQWKTRHPVISTDEEPPSTAAGP
jgi:hypothetical protein